MCESRSNNYCVKYCVIKKMKNVIFCEFAGRRKKVIFEAQLGKSDVSSLKNALLNANKTDKDLQNRMEYSAMVFQHIDLELCSQLIDIEEDDIIEDKSIVTIVSTPVEFLHLPVIDLCEASKARILDSDIGVDYSDVSEATKNINNPSTVAVNEINSKADIATIQFPEMTAETSKAKFSEITKVITMIEINFLLFICVISD